MNLIKEKSLLRIILLSTCTEENASISRRFGWASLAKSALSVAVVAGALTAGQAQAVAVNVDGLNYDVTTFQGSYNQTTEKFAVPTLGGQGTMPWWGDSILALKFSAAVGGSFGFVNPGGGTWPLPNHLQMDDAGPYFGIRPEDYSCCGASLGVILFAWERNSGGFGIPANNYMWQPSYNQYEWAQATLVNMPDPQQAPSPVPIFGAVAAFGTSRKLRTRIKSKAKL